MTAVEDIAAIATRAPVIPVLTIETQETAIPLARALVRGGLPVARLGGGRDRSSRQPRTGCTYGSVRPSSQSSRSTTGVWKINCSVE